MNGRLTSSLPSSHLEQNTGFRRRSARWISEYANGSHINSRESSLDDSRINEGGQNATTGPNDFASTVPEIGDPYLGGDEGDMDYDCEPLLSRRSTVSLVTSSYADISPAIPSLPALSFDYAASTFLASFFSRSPKSAAQSPGISGNNKDPYRSSEPSRQPTNPNSFKSAESQYDPPPGFGLALSTRTKTLEDFKDIPLTPKAEASYAGPHDELGHIISDRSFHGHNRHDSRPGHSKQRLVPSDHRAQRRARLPTPHDFQPSSQAYSSLWRDSTRENMVSRGLSFITFRTFSGDASHGPSRRGTVSSQYTAVSTDCEEPCVDVDSLRTRLSVDGGHLSLIPSVGTTSRFTHKWPRPQSLWVLGTLMDPHRPSLSVRDVVRIKQNIAQALEDGEGLGMDRVEKWTPYKWALLLSVISVFVYGLVGLICALMTWFHVWPYADVTTVVDYDVLVLTTLASSMLLLAALLGLTGTLLNSRPILAVYAVLLWPALIATAVIMYVSYRRATFALDRKLSAAWSADLTPLGRLVIQDALRCCGFYGPTHEATPSGRCYPRSPLPGCIGRLLRLERVRLKQTWRTVLGLVPVHVVNMVTATLCANHVTRRFGKGLTPRRYRLSSRDVQADAEKILGQGAVV